MFGLFSPSSTSNAADERIAGGDFATVNRSGQIINRGLSVTNIISAVVVAVVAAFIIRLFKK